MRYSLGFGKTSIALDVDDSNIIGFLELNHVDIQLLGIEEVKRAMNAPIGTKRLKDIAQPGEKIVIITSDITRPTPSKLMLPVVIDELLQAKVSKDDIKIIFALGSHRKHTEDEKRYLVGEEIYSNIECIDSDISDCVNMGTTAAGTPVDIFKLVAEADRRICLGNIEYHYFAGYSGGAKAIMPGVSSGAAIQANHSKMIMETAKAGEIISNPIRTDIEDVANFIHIDFILNVVLDEQKKIIKAVAGHHQAAHREGCKFLDEFYKIKIKEAADIVVVSAGGYPKDINLYQAQKALDNAKHAVRKGGIIILVASCKEGYGSDVFQKWIERATKSDDLVKEIHRNFELGGHKAAAIAMVLESCSIYLVSDLPDEIAKKVYMKPYSNLQLAYDAAIKSLGDKRKTIIMPFGGSTLPVIAL